MKNEKIILNALSKKPDGLGGYLEEYTEYEFYGKVAYAKDRMVITRANDINTQKLVNMKILYLKTTFNDESSLMQIKRGDKFTHKGIDYVVYLVEAYGMNFIITLLEDF